MRIRRAVALVRTPTVLVVGVLVGITAVGSATAASLITGAQIKNGTITGKDLRNRSITGADLKDRSIAGADIKDRSISSADLKSGELTTASLSTAAVEELQETGVTQVVSTAAAAASPWAATLEARCPEGHVATGGGGSLVTNPDLGDLRWSRPILDANGTPVGWQGRLVNASQNDDTAQLYVICTPGAQP